MTTIWPGRCGNLFPVLKQTDGISLAEAKAEAKALTVGRTEFLKATGWRSEPAYKKAM